MNEIIVALITGIGFGDLIIGQYERYYNYFDC